MIAGLTTYITKGHLARAVLEATAWQTHLAAEWLPRMDPVHRDTEYANWRRAVELTFNWTQADDPAH